DMTNPVVTSPKLQAVQQINGGTKQSVTIGTAAPGSVDGKSWSMTKLGYETPGSGAYTMSGPGWASYNFNGSGTYAAHVNYTTSGAATAKVYVDGALAGTINAAGGTATYNSGSQLLNGELHAIRVEVASGSITINSVSLN